MNCKLCNDPIPEAKGFKVDDSLRPSERFDEKFAYTLNIDFRSDDNYMTGHIMLVGVCPKCMKSMWDTAGK